MNMWVYPPLYIVREVCVLTNQPQTFSWELCKLNSESAVLNLYFINKHTHTHELKQAHSNYTF